MISPESTSNQAVRETINRMKEASDDVKHNLASAQEQMKCPVDKATHAEEWTVGDQVFLSTRNLQMFALHLPQKP